MVEQRRLGGAEACSARSSRDGVVYAMAPQLVLRIAAGRGSDSGAGVTSKARWASECGIHHSSSNANPAKASNSQLQQLGTSKINAINTHGENGQCWHGHNCGGNIAFLPSPLFTCSFIQIKVTLSRTSVLLGLYVCIQGFATPNAPAASHPSTPKHGRSVSKLR